MYLLFSWTKCGQIVGEGLAPPVKFVRNPLPRSSSSEAKDLAAVESEGTPHPSHKACRLPRIKKRKLKNTHHCGKLHFDVCFVLLKFFAELSYKKATVSLIC